MRNHITDYLLLLLLAVIWSMSFLLIKIGVETVGPITLTTVRLCIAAVIFLLFLLFKREWIPMHRQALQLYFVVGLIGNTLPFMLISQGEVYVDSSMAAILMGIMPISTFILAHFFIAEEPITSRKMLGVGLGFAGLVTLVGLTALKGLNENILGQLAVLGGALSYSFSAIYVKYQPSFKGYQMATGVALSSAITSIPLAFIFEDPLAMNPSMASISAITLLAIFSTTIASLIYFRVIRQLGATTFSQINYLVPVLGSIWGVILLGEILEMRMIFALLLVLCGIYFIQSKTAG